MELTREARVLRLIARQQVDYLPSHMYFSSTETKENVRTALGFSTMDELDQYLDCHLYYAFALDDTIFRYRQDPERLRWVESLGFCRIDWEAGIVYDRWGIGLDMHSPGYCVRHHPARPPLRHAGRGPQPRGRSHPHLGPRRRTDHRPVPGDHAGRPRGEYRGPGGNDPRPAGRFLRTQSDAACSQLTIFQNASTYLGRALR